MKCEIIQDLLPLYHDGVCSAESRAAVEDHLQTCDPCRRALADMDTPLPEAERKQARGDGSALKRLSQEWRRTTWKARLKGAAAAITVCALLAGLWMMATRWQIFEVDPKDIRVTDVRQLSDGRIIYHCCIDDSRYRTAVWEFGEEGDLWIVPKRALLNEIGNHFYAGDDVDMTLSFPILKGYAQDNGVEAEIVRIWYGQGEDRLLLWEEGMDLPAASTEDEARWGFDQKSAEYWFNRQS